MVVVGRSPFPGMDPYLEHPALWPDVHQKLASQIQTQLTPALRPKYYAALVPRWVIDQPDAEELRILYPDIAVHRPPQRLAETAPAYALSTETAPPGLEVVNVVAERFKQVTVQVRTVGEGQLVTVIELLSPVNKRPGTPGRTTYLRKRISYLLSTVHLLEIDLLRRGERIPVLEPLPAAPYFVFLSREERRPICQVWPIYLQDPLPTVPVPLLEPDADVPLDLQAVLTRVYEQAGYDLRIDYTAEPVPPLSAEDAAWADALLK